MTYITKKITTEDGISKLAFYQIIGRETPKWEIVETIDYIGEYTEKELNNIKDNLNQQILDIESKLKFFI